MSHLLNIYKRLLAHYGGQSWWPAETPFEVMVGAILTQNTSWQGVEKAIENLKQVKLLAADAIVNSNRDTLAEQLKPSGYFNIKAQRLINYCHWYIEQNGLEGLQLLETKALRRRLLSVNGVGPETADDILLYAFNRPVFVIDAYTRRIFSRLGNIEGSEGYETLRALFEDELNMEVSGRELVTLFNEYHALIVIHAKNHCRKRPACTECPLTSLCEGKQG